MDHRQGKLAFTAWHIRPTEYRCYIKEGEIQCATAGAAALSRNESFVCQTTPHFGSTSRRVSYSVRKYHTR